MNITYNDYPTMLFLSYDKDNAPAELPFEVASLQARDYLAMTTGFQELFGYIPAKNSLEGKNTTTNYLLTDETYHKIDGNECFRNEQFQQFFQKYVKPRHGTILFKDGGQYVYLLLGKHETKALKKREGRYMCVAFFKNNFFAGFEEGIIMENRIDVFPTGNYDTGMDRGGFLSFCIITLSWTNDKQLPIYKNDLIKETIFEI